MELTIGPPKNKSICPVCATELIPRQSNQRFHFPICSSRYHNRIHHLALTESIPRSEAKDKVDQAIVVGDAIKFFPLRPTSLEAKPDNGNGCVSESSDMSSFHNAAVAQPDSLQGLKNSVSDKQDYVAFPKGDSFLKSQVKSGTPSEKGHVSPSHPDRQAEGDEDQDNDGEGPKTRHMNEFECPCPGQVVDVIFKRPKGYKGSSLKPYRPQKQKGKRNVS